MIKIESCTYFEEVVKPDSLGCQVAYGWHDEKDLLQMNPPYVTVENDIMDFDAGIIYVNNTHEYDLPLKPTTLDPLSHVFGFWRIKYKS